ncbi:hypothetical protein MKK70_15625 [Methylobacterium sp. E-041]|uniref:hypothetical protein n=1 Tax=Methylobacterium sp. E-041 TaxID=2836573 RepID=UPI001FB9AEA0|nr:hypothetical protein [Methylobacterium sp. E-041]MCJ2106777.1 hypothetical protein [Methylobacterium sp. E-041]
MIVAGECGRGSGEYDTGLFTLPAGGDRGAETIATVTVHGGVGEKQSTLGQVLTGLRGGLALAQQMDLTMPVTVAATALGAGLGALDSGPKQRALIEVVFQDGTTMLAMTDVGIAALMENDRRVIQLAAERFNPEPALIAPSETGIAAKVIASAEDAAHTAGSAVSGAFSFIKKTLG